MSSHRSPSSRFLEKAAHLHYDGTMASRLFNIDRSYPRRTKVGGMHVHSSLVSVVLRPSTRKNVRAGDPVASGKL